MTDQASSNQPNGFQRVGTLIKENPVAVGLTAAGVGFGIGWLIIRSLRGGSGPSWPARKFAEEEKAARERYELVYPEGGEYRPSGSGYRLSER